MKGVVEVAVYQAKELREGVSDWLNGFPWQVFLTGTFKEEMGVNSTFRTKALFKMFLNAVRKEGRSKSIDYFLAIERFKSGDLTHVHCLINGANLSDHALWSIWFRMYGRAVVEGYDKKLGAHHYITKYILKDLCDWDLEIKRKDQLKLL